MIHLRGLYNKADDVDRREGAMAYPRYHDLLARIADHYGMPLDRTVAAFVALSPNSDYFGNLRSLVSVLEGVRAGWSWDEITVSTYKHCRDRALAYLTGQERFLDHAKGPKTRAFYMNILSPENPRPVTVDGHIYCAWVGRDMPMSEARVTDKLYDEIAQAIREIAFSEFLIPNQVQATIWFCRKRLQRIKYFDQLDLFHASDDQWRTLPAIRDIKPYPRAA